MNSLDDSEKSNSISKEPIEPGSDPGTKTDENFRILYDENLYPDQNGFPVDKDGERPFFGRSYDSVTENESRDSSSIFDRAVRARRAYRFGEALILLDKILDSSPGDCRALNEMGKICLVRCELSQASYFFKTILRTQPKDLHALRGMGMLLRKSGNQAAAETYFNKILDLYPNDRETLHELGLAELEQGLVQKAVAHFYKAAGMEDPTQLMMNAAPQLTSMMAAKAIAGGVAHEIKNPLCNIHLVVSALWEMVQADQGEISVELTKGLSEIREQVARMNDVVSSFSKMVRHESVPLEALDVEQMLLHAFTYFEAQLQNRNINVEILVPPVNLPLIYGHRKGLEQVFINLITNARDALKQTEVGRIKVEVRLSGEGLEIWFEDNGPGIASEDHSKLFELGFTTKGEDGTGMGLWLSDCFVKGQGGSIKLDDSFTEGTRFLIGLKRQEKE